MAANRRHTAVDENACTVAIDIQPTKYQQVITKSSGNGVMMGRIHKGEKKISQKIIEVLRKAQPTPLMHKTIWGRVYKTKFDEGCLGVLYVHVWLARQQLKENERIVTIRGVGYAYKVLS